MLHSVSGFMRIVSFLDHTFLIRHIGLYIDSYTYRPRGGNVCLHNLHASLCGIGCCKKLISDKLNARRISASLRDHPLLFQSYSSQRQHRFGFITVWHGFQEVNCLWSATLGKAAKLLIDWLDAAYRLVFPLRQVALAQLNNYYHQRGNAGYSESRISLQYTKNVT